MTKYELTTQERELCITFLARVQLQGNEVPAFNTVINALNKEMQEKESKGKKETGEEENASI